MHSDLTKVISHPEERLTEPQVHHTTYNKKYFYYKIFNLLSSYVTDNLTPQADLHSEAPLGAATLPREWNITWGHKGSDLLIDKDGLLNVADFGLANFYKNKPRQYLTSPVVTL